MVTQTGHSPPSGPQGPGHPTGLWVFKFLNKKWYSSCIESTGIILYTLDHLWAIYNTMFIVQVIMTRKKFSTGESFGAFSMCI